MVNLVRSKDPPISVYNAEKILPQINYLLCANNSEVKADALWALSFIADFDGEYIDVIIESKILPLVMSLLSSHNLEVMAATTRLIGNLANRKNQQIHLLIKHGVFHQICYPLMHHNAVLRREALSCLSKIASGSQFQLNAFFTCTELLKLIVENLYHLDTKTRYEALCCVSYMIKRGSEEQILVLINKGAIEPLFLLMKVSSSQEDKEMAKIAQKLLFALFKKADELIEQRAKLFKY